MKLINVEQGTKEWLQERAGIVTASELGNLFTSALEPRKWSTEMPNTYLNRKLAERWLGRPLESFGGGTMQQGTLREDDNIKRLELELDCDIERVGIIKTDDGKFGASPDGLIRDAKNIGVECKCPQPHTHVQWLRDHATHKMMPVEHALQVQAGMMVAETDEWIFASYCPEFPLLVVRVRKDHDLCAKIATVVEEFNRRLGEEYEVLLKLNGGKR